MFFDLAEIQKSKYIAINFYTQYYHNHTYQSLLMLSDIRSLISVLKKIRFAKEASCFRFIESLPMSLFDVCDNHLLTVNKEA